MNMGIPFKKALQLAGVEKFDSVLEVGCDNSDIRNDFNIKNYTGIVYGDFSYEANVDNVKYFKFKDISNVGNYDLVVCTELILSELDEDGLLCLLDILNCRADKRIIICGSKIRNASTENSSYMHGDKLKEIISSGCDYVHLYKFFENDKSVIIVVDKIDDAYDKEKLCNDISQKDSELSVENIDNPDLLLSAISASRTSFGWFTKHYPRIFEYPWVLENLRSFCENNFVVAEFGAGISPLPLMLSMYGAKVYTVDYGTAVSLEEIKNGNEWGFFDYSCIDQDICSLNADLSKKMFGASSLDCWISVSVIEHLSSFERKRVFSIISKTLKKNGSLIITIDLKKGTNDLWNYNYGKKVEPIEIHGNLDDLVNELQDFGFCDVQVDKIFMPLTEKVDIALLKAKLSEKKGFLGKFFV